MIWRFVRDPACSNATKALSTTTHCATILKSPDNPSKRKDSTVINPSYVVDNLRRCGLAGELGVAGRNAKAASKHAHRMQSLSPSDCFAGWAVRGI